MSVGTHQTAADILDLCVGGPIVVNRGCGVPVLRLQIAIEPSAALFHHIACDYRYLIVMLFCFLLFVVGGWGGSVFFFFFFFFFFLFVFFFFFFCFVFLFFFFFLMR